VACLEKTIDMTDLDALERRAGTAMNGGFCLVVAAMATHADGLDDAGDGDDDRVLCATRRVGRRTCGRCSAR